MSSKKDYYEILGVKKDASDDELKSAYRKLALRYHPDKCKDPDAKDKFSEINEAYEVLSNKNKRAAYDQFGFDGLNGTQGFSSAGFNPFDVFKAHFGGNSPFTADDLFSSFGDSPFGFSPFGGNAHHGKRSTPDLNAPENGADLQMEMPLEFKESLYGCVKDIEATLDVECSACGGKGIETGSKLEKCKRCSGTGRIVHVEKHGFMTMQNISECPDCNGWGMSAKLCHACNGKKRVSAKKNISIRIPQGIADGQRLRVQGKGECGIKGGKDGDMYIRVHVKPSKLFKRDGNDLDLITYVPVDAITATLGGKIAVRTPWETLKVDVPIKTISGARSVLKGSGVHSSAGNGDLIVVFEVEPLENINLKQKKLLEELKATLNDNNVCKMNDYKKICNNF